MRRRIFLVLAALPVLLLAIAWIYISNPSTVPVALPPALVSLDDPEGARLLAAATARADFDRLAAQAQQQEKRSWCGPASVASVLSAWKGKPLAQADILGALSPGAAIRATFGGMTLDTLRRMIEENGATAIVERSATAADFKVLLASRLADPGDFLVVNYSRPVLEQDGGGHFSPVAALSGEQVLVLDTAPHYPPTWVPVARLWAAMDTIDPDSGEKRGFVEVR